MSAPRGAITINGSGGRMPIRSPLCLDGSASVARHHVLGDALQAEHRICNERHGPKSAVAFAQIVRGEHRSRALYDSDAIGTSYSRVRAVQVGRLRLHIAHVGFTGEPVLTGKERRVRVSKGAGRGDHREADKARADNFSLGGFEGGCRNRRFYHEVVSHGHPAGSIR